MRTASEVTEHNVMSLIHQINTGKKYAKPPKPDRFTLAPPTNETSTLDEVTEEDEEAAEIEEKLEDLNIKDCDDAKKQKPRTPVLELNKLQSNVILKFLPLGTMDQLPKKRNFPNSFDLIYLSNSQVSYFTPELTAILKDDADVVVENVKFVTPLSKDLEKGYLPKIKELATSAKCELLGSNDEMMNEYHLSFHRVE